VRANNEDSWYADPEGRLFLVADGMGGHAGGEVASALVARAVTSSAAEAGGWEDPRAELRRLLERADADVQGQAAGPLRGMGSTAVVLFLREGRAWIAHAGDSRAYRWRARRLVRLTIDHTPEVELGYGTLGGRSGMLTRAIGIGAEPVCDVDETDAQPGDLVLLCSDGLTDMVADAGIGALLGAAGSPEGAASALVDAANEAGGRDNVTVVVISVE